MSFDNEQQLQQQQNEESAGMNSESALSEAYKMRLKPCLDAIDYLRASGMQHEIPLPSIAVVGDQSVGKSSVLEAISGIEFPRGSGIVTRCPLQLSMRCRDDVEWSASIRYMSKNGTAVEKPVRTAREVGEQIRAAQNDIAGHKGEISDTLIDMHVESRDVPDLTLIDLPGIARFSAEYGGQVAEMTKKLINTYIEKPEVLILVVIPCHVDVETVEAIVLAKEVDPQSNRTIGVLTCPDLVNPGAEADVLSLMQNKKIPLKKGYVSLRCRSQQQLKDNMSLKESYDEEERFFRRHKQFRQLNDFERGSRTLAIKLSDELFKSVRDSIPSMIREVQEWRDKYGQQLQMIGEGPPTDESGKKEVLASMFRKFCEEFRVVSQGVHRHEKNKLYSKFRMHSTKFCDEVHLFLTKQTEASRAMWDDVRRLVEEQRGRELPGFDNVYPVVEALVRKHFVEMVRSPCSQLNLVINQEVDETLRAIADNHFIDFPKLNQRVKEISERIRTELVDKSKNNIEMLLRQEEQVFTQDKLYCLEHDRLTGNKELLSSIPNNTSAKVEDESGGSSKEKAEKTKDSAAVLSFLEESTDENTNRVLNGVYCYMSIAVRRLVDYVPMVVMYHMLNEMSEQLSNKMTVMLTEPESLFAMLEQEEYHIVAKRQFLRDKISKLSDAEAQLARL